MSDQKHHHAAIAMENTEIVDQSSPVVQGERIALAVPAADLFDRRSRFAPADGIPNQSLEPIERVDSHGLVNETPGC
jgi:hypothetical protein